MSKSTPYPKRAKNGTWYVHWTENRIGKRVTTGTKSEAEARLFLAHWILTEGDDPKGRQLGAGLSLADVWSVYYKRHVSVKVANVYNADLAWKQLEPHFGSLPAGGLTQAEIDAYVDKRTSGKLGRKVKPQTVAKELSYIGAAVKFCADPRRGVIEPEFARRLSLPEPGAARDRWLRTEEIQALLDAAARLRRDERLSRVERFLWLALETAARKQAIFDLTWDRVDFETNVINYDVPGRRRTKKKRAAVPISKALRPILDRMYAERTGDLVMDNKGEVWAPVQLAVIEAGLGGKVKKPAGKDKPKATGISPHVLRHTAATHMARRRVPLYIIAAILGNTVQMVEKVYGHHAKEDLQAAVDMISGGYLEAAE